MKDIEKEYLNELVRLDVSQDDCEKTKKILAEVGDVADTLANPLVTHDEKRNIINRLFPESVQKFIMNAVKEGQVGKLGELLEDYSDLLIEKQGSIKAVVRYVTPLTETQQADLKKFIMEKFIKDDVDIEYRKDPDIIGGFILTAGDVEYDKSYRTGLRQMKETLQTRLLNTLTAVRQTRAGDPRIPISYPYSRPRSRTSRSSRALQLQASSPVSVTVSQECVA